MKKTASLCLIALVLLLTACAVDSEGTKLQYQPENLPPKVTDLMYNEILKLEGTNQILVGYVEETSVSYEKNKDSAKIHYIKDKYFKTIGFSDGNGITYRYGPKNNPEKIGTYALDDAIRKLLDFNGPIYLRRLQTGIIFDY
jgi:hypothetical protein